MKIAIVNDMPLATEALRRAVSVGALHQVVWTAATGREAVEKCREQLPELLLMDLVMPELDGVDATREIMAATPCPILVVTASVNEHADLVFAAMGAGALDAVNTPVLGSDRRGVSAAALLDKMRVIEILTQLPKQRGVPAASAGVMRAIGAIEMIAIGASSGGPVALAQILARLPPDLPVPVVVVQHVDPQFARMFARWLGQQTQISVKTVDEPVVPMAGSVYVACCDRHLELDERGRLVYTDNNSARFYRPSVDVFFDSVAQRLRGKCIAVLLTGMGRDGAEGMLKLRMSGHITVAQDSQTSAVYGMPRAAAEIGAATHVLPLPEISSFIRGMLMRDVAAAPAPGLRKVPNA